MVTTLGMAGTAVRKTKPYGLSQLLFPNPKSFIRAVFVQWFRGDAGPHPLGATVSSHAEAWKDSEFGYGFGMAPTLDNFDDIGTTPATDHIFRRITWLLGLAIECDAGSTWIKDAEGRGEWSKDHGVIHGGEKTAKQHALNAEVVLTRMKLTGLLGRTPGDDDMMWGVEQDRIGFQASPASVQAATLAAAAAATKAAYAAAEAAAGAAAASRSSLQAAGVLPLSASFGGARECGKDCKTCARKAR
jgi:hypothetical protein